MERKLGIVSVLISLVFAAQMVSPAPSLGQEIGSDSLLTIKWKSKLSQSGGYPLVRNDVIFLNSEVEGAYDVSTGKKILFSDPLIKQKFIGEFSNRYIVFRQLSKFIVIDLYNGKIVNTILHSNMIYDTPILLESSIGYFNIDYQTFQAINVITSQRIWEFKSNSAINSNYLVTDSKVIIYNRENIYCLDKLSGKVIWQSKLGEVVSNIILKESNLYAIVSNKGIYCINLKTGETKILLSKLMQSTYTIAADDQNLYFISVDLIQYNITENRITWKSTSEPLLSNYLTLIGDYIVGQFSDYGGSGPLAFFDRRNGELLRSYSDLESEDGFKLFKFSNSNMEILIGCENDFLYGFSIR